MIALVLAATVQIRRGPFLILGSFGLMSDQLLMNRNVGDPQVFGDGRLDGHIARPHALDEVPGA